ncbi:MAG: LysM peptidoglycan-binding domain-containing protein [Anaerolineaceae bacterium]
MSDKNSPKSVIGRFEKRQQMMPFFLGALAGFLALLGILIIVMVVAGANNPFSGLFATKTPTPTMTYTPSPSPLPSNTPTITPTSGPTSTPVPVGPQQYVVVSGDNCVSIADSFKVNLEVLLAVNNLDQNCSIIPGQTITIPGQNAVMPTRTPLPTGLPRGTQITVTVQTGDSIKSLADEYDSTVDDIVKINKLTDANTIYVGQKLIIRINLATKTPTLAPTSTPSNLVTPLPSATK